MKNLKKILNERKISQKEFAEKIKITPAALNNYIMEKTEPNFKLLKQIANELNVTIDFLLNNESFTSINLNPEKEKLLKTINNLNEIECHKLDVFAQGLIMNRNFEQKERTLKLIKDIEEEK